ncbi:PREDICTED: uncharacterized protein LOC109465035 isoform X2 [Branchiostoma belcheri]|uniref:Uncharacterized protein LOC109465035 isoform X2 n=1 Tax=Branchiostoma belcheri TaxID=7741 RepID=A0A6P4Y5U1_BRABE|nr:PREDICTED: uncharacterized protein LOC109465035 isoform X2 [Branchiostoma belcheri]
MAEDNSSDSAPTLSTCSSAIVNSTTQVSSNLCTGSGQSSGDFDSEPTSVAADEHRSQNVQCYNAPYPQFVNPMYTPGVPSASTLQADMCDGIPGDDGSDNNTLHTAAESGQTVNVTPGDDNIEPDQPDEIQAGNSDGIRPCAVRYQEAAAEGGQTIDGDIGDDNIEPYAVCEEDVQMTVSPGHAPASDEKGNTVGQQQATCVKANTLSSEVTKLSSVIAKLSTEMGNRFSSIELRLKEQERYPPSSCTEVAERGGFDTQAFYVIDPDGPGRGVRPMFVHCDLDGQTAITLIGHDSETRTHVKGFEGRGSYSKNVTYWNSLEQVRAVVNQSSRCKQLIKYECHGSFIWKSNVRRHAWWVTWDGRQADYWGGASPGSGKCACGETGTCRGRCNCDVNDYTWREDSGFLSHKNDLPVTQLRFGDTGDTCVLPEDEEGYHTLGKLICYP